MITIAQNSVEKGYVTKLDKFRTAMELDNLRRWTLDIREGESPLDAYISRLSQTRNAVTPLAEKSILAIVEGNKDIRKPRAVISAYS